MRRLALLFVAPLALVLAACDVFQFTLSVDRVAEVQGTDVLLRGRVTCTESEPIQLQVTIAQGSLSQSDATEINCLGDDPWSHTFTFLRGFQVGEATATVFAQTRPEHVQDALQLTRKVLLLPPGS